MPNVKLKRLKIEKYRDVEPGTELCFNDTFNVLLGKNGTGKTTLLRLIAMVVTGDFAALKEAEFAIEYDIAYLGVSIRVHVENRRTEGALPRLPEFQLPLPVASLPNEANGWSYFIESRMDSTPDVYSVSASPLGATLHASNRPEVSDTIPLVSPFDSGLNMMAVTYAKDLADAKPRQFIDILKTQLHLLSSGGRFDEALGCFGAMTSTSDQDTNDRLTKAQFQFTIESGTKASGKILSPFCPKDMFFDLSKSISLQPAPESIVASHTKLGFLRKTVDLFGFEGAEIFLRMLRKNVADGRDTLIYGNFFFRFTLEQGSVVTQDALSYGQKRLLSFLYYVACNDDIIIADELVNGMHYDWIEACIDEIGDRQSFLTSQNPLLLDFLTFASTDEVEKTFIQCSREKSEGGRAKMRWANLSREHAESFYRAYEAGVQHVGDILRTKGLW